MIASRRTMLRAGVGGLTAGLLGYGAPRCRGPARTITIASGEEGGLYLEFANLLANQINGTEPGLLCVATKTPGSITNLKLVQDGHADLALTQADAALAALAGRHPFDTSMPIRAIGRVYEDYLQLAVLAHSPLYGVADLTGRRVSVGAEGSGTAMVSERLIVIAGLGVTRVYSSLQEAARMLEHGQIDALFWAGGVPTPALAAVHARVGIRILPLADLVPPLRRSYGAVYQQVRLPPGTYGETGVATLGVANLLTCSDTLPEDVAAAMARTLVLRSAQLVPHQTLGTQFLDPHTVISTRGIPIHQGAASAYRALRG